MTLDEIAVQGIKEVLDSVQKFSVRDERVVKDDLAECQSVVDLIRERNFGKKPNVHLIEDTIQALTKLERSKT